jgi:hypothetical protein
MNSHLHRGPGPWHIKGAFVTCRVGGDHSGLFSHLLNLFTIAEESVDGEPIRVRIARDENTDLLVEKVNSLVGKKVNLVVHRSPWAVCGKSGITNFLQSIEEG